MIVIATEVETELVEKVLGPQVGEFGPVVRTGVGGANVCETLRDIPRDTPILNIGYAGSANTPIGTLVDVSESRVYHPNVTYKEPVYHLPVSGERPSMRCLTSNDFVLQSDEHDCLFDMELVYICALGFSNLRSIKMVSDNLSLHEYDQNTGDDNCVKS